MSTLDEKILGFIPTLNSINNPLSNTVLLNTRKECQRMAKLGDILTLEPENHGIHMIASGYFKDSNGIRSYVPVGSTLREEIKRCDCKEKCNCNRGYIDYKLMAAFNPKLSNYGLQEHEAIVMNLVSEDGTCLVLKFGHKLQFLYWNPMDTLSFFSEKYLRQINSYLNPKRV